MKGESREAKGHKSIGDGRTWYGKRETLMPPVPPTCMTYHHLIIHGEYVWT